MSSNVLALPLFTDEKKASSDVAILGLQQSKRIRKYIARDYVDADESNLAGYKVVLPKAIGVGTFGEPLGTLELEEPGEGYTHTFMGIGNLATRSEGHSLCKYLTTKLARSLLGLLKVTQDNTLDKWAYVPLQDFTPDSDIDWSQSVADIDRQLYAKYGLDDDEIAFIESHVKEMD